MKKIILWEYKRGTWQYDIFCLLIIAFIFLTPKTWFENKEKVATQTTHSVVKAEDFSLVKTKMKNQIKELSKNNNKKIDIR